MQKDDAWWLKVTYVSFFLLMTFVAFKAIETVGIQTGWMERFEWFTYAADVGALALGAFSTWFLRMDKERDDYLLSSIQELRKVAWPSWNDTKKMTRIVVVVVGVFAVIVGIFDIIWAKVLKSLFQFA